MFKKVKTLLKDQLKTGATPKKLSEAVVAGIIIGIFPVLGTTTLLSVLVGFIFGLNQIVIQTVNYLMYPVQILMIPVYIKMVSLIFDVGNVPIRPDLIIKQFNDGPLLFLKLYGIVGVYSLGLWAILSVVLFFILRPIIYKAVIKLQGNRPWNG